MRDATLIPGSPYPPRISLGFPPMSTNHTNLVVLRTHSQVEQGGTTKPRSHPRLTATVPHRFDPAHRHGTGNKKEKQTTSTRRNGPKAAGGAQPGPPRRLFSSKEQDDAVIGPCTEMSREKCGVTGRVGAHVCSHSLLNLNRPPSLFIPCFAGHRRRLPGTRDGKRCRGALVRWAMSQGLRWTGRSNGATTPSPSAPPRPQRGNPVGWCMRASCSCAVIATPAGNQRHTRTPFSPTPPSLLSWDLSSVSFLVYPCQCLVEENPKS